MWASQDLRLLYDDVAPSGSTEIRLLPNLPRGEIVHPTAPAFRVSEPAVLSELVPSVAGVAIPPATPFQYRTGAQSLGFLVITRSPMGA